MRESSPLDELAGDPRDKGDTSVPPSALLMTADIIESLLCAEDSVCIVICTYSVAGDWTQTQQLVQDHRQQAAEGGPRSCLPTSKLHALERGPPTVFMSVSIRLT